MKPERTLTSVQSQTFEGNRALLRIMENALMPVVWCSISGHGFGHAAQVVPILNELATSKSNVAHYSPNQSSLGLFSRLSATPLATATLSTRYRLCSA